MKSYLYLIITILFVTSCKKENFTNIVSDNTVDNSSVVRTGLVFIAKAYNFDSTTLYALNIKTGTVKWKFTSKAMNSQFSYTPCVAQNKLFMLITQGSPRPSTLLIALNASTGKIIWKVILRNYGLIYPLTNPTFENGNVYVGLETTLFSINAENGSINWKKGYDLNTGYNYLCSPTVQNNSIYVGNNIHLFALDAANGAIKWQVQAGLHSSTPTVANGLVTLIDGYDGYIKAYDFKGRLKWQNSKYYLYGSTTTSQNKVYRYEEFGDSIEGFGLDAASGLNVWDYKQTKDNNPINSAYGDPFQIENTLYISLKDSLLAINIKDQATKKWSFYTGIPVCSNCMSHSSVVAGRGYVFDMALDDNLYALSAKDGSFIWKFSADDQYYSYSPVILFDDGVAIHPTNSGMTQ